MDNIFIRSLNQTDLPAADRIMRLAFGTFLGLPDPMAFMGDANYVHSRWHADPKAAFAAEINGEIGGSNFASHWGSVGFFGPLTVHPEHWSKGLAKRLMEPVLGTFESWGVRHAGLFTFAQSEKHIGLYRKFGFWPRFLTALMSKPVGQSDRQITSTKFSDLAESERPPMLAKCRELTESIYEGLDIAKEILAVATLGLGETILLWDELDLAGFAVCHCGASTEAGSGTCYIKFGAARIGESAPRDFLSLIDACEALAASKGLKRIVAGVNTARHEAYRGMLERGFRTDLQGVAMHRDNVPGYNRPGVFLIDDWR